MESRLCLVLFIAYTCLAIVLSCSCPPESSSKTREQEIRDDFECSANVYSAIVSSANCKCFAASENPAQCPTILNCVSYAISDNGAMVVESVQKRCECLQGFPCPSNSFHAFPDCERVKEVLASSSSLDVTPDQFPSTKVNGEENCDATGLSNEDCQLLYQPCYYNVTVTTVYKGSLVPGDVLATPGPDVLTTCGDFGRLLTLGVEYVVGIGGPCSPIQQWSTLASFSNSEVALLESLRDSDSENPSSCGGTMGTDPTLATPAVTTSDTDPITTDTDPTLATVMTTSDNDPGTTDTDPTLATVMTTSDTDPSTTDTDPTHATVVTTSDTEPLTRITDSTESAMRIDASNSGSLPVYHLGISLLFALVVPFYHLLNID